MKGCLQTETFPQDGGGYSLGLSGPALTVPPRCECTLYERRCFLLSRAAGYLPQMASKTGPAQCQSRLLRHSPLRTGYRRFYCFSVQFPLANPVEVPPTPSQSGVAEHQTPGPALVYAQGQPLCWARCPCVVIPLRLIQHVYSSMVRLPSW